jgi:putative phosphoesterase
MFRRPHDIVQEPHTLLKRPHARRIGLISDTHVPGRQHRFDPQIAEIFSDTDLILHAGDIAIPKVIRNLEKIAETIAVRGNNRGDLTHFYPPLPLFLVIEPAFHFRIGLTHGMYSQWQRFGDNIIGRSGFANKGSLRLVRRIVPYFRDADCIVFGHGHWPFLHHTNNTLFINPGRAFGNDESSCAVMDLAESQITIQYHLLGKPGRIRDLTATPHVFTSAKKTNPSSSI